MSASVVENHLPVEPQFTIEESPIRHLKIISSLAAELACVREQLDESNRQLALFRDLDKLANAAEDELLDTLKLMHVAFEHGYNSESAIQLDGIVKSIVAKHDGEWDQQLPARYAEVGSL